MRFWDHIRLLWGKHPEYSGLKNQPFLIQPLSNLSVAIFNYSKIFHIAEDSGIIYT